MNQPVLERDIILARSDGRLPELRALRLERCNDYPRIGNLLSPGQQDLLRDIASLVSFGHGDDISAEGTDAQFVYTVVTGMVRISRCAKAISTASPDLWPSASLTCLKPSRST